MLQDSPIDAYDIAVLGAGYGGLMAALRLGGRRRRPARIVLINASDVFVERIRGQEAITAAVVPRIPSLATLLAGTGVDLVVGSVTSLDAEQRRVTVAVGEDMVSIGFEQAIYALGSRTDIAQVPGIARHAFRLDPGDDPRGVAALRARLAALADGAPRVLVVGGAETAVEAAGEIKATWPRADVAMLSSRRCGEFKGPRVGAVVRAELTRLGVRLMDGVNAVEVTEEGVISATGLVPCEVCVWAGGLRGSPIAPAAGIGTDQRDRIWVDPNLRSISHPHIFAVGDAARPIAPTGAPYRLSALAAAASGAYAADVIRAALRHRRLPPFSFSTYGQGIAIGHGGVGFTSYPDDEAAAFSIVRGRSAYYIRNLFVWFFAFALKLERKLPGAFPIVGRHRVSWQRAEEAMCAGPPPAASRDFGRSSA